MIQHVHRILPGMRSETQSILGERSLARDKCEPSRGRMGLSCAVKDGGGLAGKVY